MEEYSSKKRVRDDWDELRFVSPEVKRIKEDLLENFDDGETYAASHELDSFMKSFAEEIASATNTSEAVTDLASESVESRPEIGYLLEASDDELGIPSTSKEAEEDEKTESGRVESDSFDVNGGCGLWGLDEGIPGFDSFEFGAFDGGNYSNEYVALDGLFDYSDQGFGSSDSLWRPETLPAN